jgi:hypothetical protein
VTTAEYIKSFVYPTAATFLPARMDTPAAKAMVLATGFQESGFQARRQAGNGPARGFWQFEEGGGLAGVLSHPASKPFIHQALPILVVKPWECFDALANNDVLACLFARLLLWTHPPALPARTDAEGAWNYYRATWRPGRPHAETWSHNYRRAWEMVSP